MHRTDVPYPQRTHLYITGTVLMQVRLERNGTVGAVQVLDSSILPGTQRLAITYEMAD